MNIHERIEDWMATALAGGLTNEEKAAFEQHLAGCPTCQKLYREEQMASSLLEKTLEVDRPPTGFETRMVARFREDVQKRRGILGWLWTPFAALARSRPIMTAIASLCVLCFVIAGLLTPAISRSRESARFSNCMSNVRTIGLASKQYSIDSAKSMAASDAAANSRVSGETARSLTNATGGDDSWSDGKESAINVGRAGARTHGKFAAAPGISSKEIDGKPASNPSEPPIGVPDSRKLIRNAQMELEVEKFDTAFQQIAGIVGEVHGFVANTSSQRLPTGKVRGEVIVKVLPPDLERVVLRLKALGDLKNQTISTQDVTKDYFETDARLRNARKLEERLIAMLDRTTGKVADLLEVEKEIARVRGEIEQLQGSLKVYDSLVQYATITLQIYEKDLGQPAETPVQNTGLLIHAPQVEEQVRAIKQAAVKFNARICSSSYNRSADGDEAADITLRVPMGKYAELMDVIKTVGTVKQSTISRVDRVDSKPEEGIAEIGIRLYSHGAMVGVMRAGTSFYETLHATALKGFEALFWTLQQIGIGLAFILPWAIVIGPIVWIILRLRKKRNAVK
jgi:hypothetical protein